MKAAEEKRLAELKEKDPAAYEKEINAAKPAHKGLEGLKSDSRRGSLKSDSRRGSLLLPESRSRQGSIVLGGTERRGSYYHEEVTTRQSVAMVTDDPEHKKNLKNALAGAFAENGDIGTAAANGTVNGDLSSVIASGGDILAGLPADASEEEISARLKAAGLSESQASMMIQAKKGKGLSPESRALMEQILASNASQDEISSRVSALLAGTALSTTRGVAKGEGREIDMVQYEGANLSEAKERRATTEGSVKRQSEIMREKKKSRQEERDEERERKASYYRRVTGLRRAKVPLMVYSCGGF